MSKAAKNKRYRENLKKRGLTSGGTAQARRRRKLIREEGKDRGPFEPLWDQKCENCGESPTVRETGLCGPCTFGEADTAGGNW